MPSGASKGDYEAVELRDGSPGYDGKGVLKAVKNVNQLLGPALITSRLSCDQQTEIDQLLCGLDGTKNKSNLGANAILGCSMAVARAGAAEKVRRCRTTLVIIGYTSISPFVRARSTNSRRVFRYTSSIFQCSQWWSAFWK